MTRKQSAAEASGLHTDHYRHEDKLIGCVRACVCVPALLHALAVCFLICASSPCCRL